MRQGLILVLGGAAFAAAVAGCSEDPSLYLGGPPGAVARHAISRSSMTVIVGDSATLGARADDAAGNATATAPTIAACGTGVVAVGSSTPSDVYTTSVWVRGTALGSGCLTVTTGSIVDTVRVVTGPAAVRIEGATSLGSGNDTTYTIVAKDRAGTLLTGSTAYTWTSSNKARIAVDPATGQAFGKSTGAADVRLFAPGGANATLTVTVVAGVFRGTLSAASGAPGALITATRAADGPFFDADTQVRLGTTAAFVDQITPSSAIFAVPATGSTAQATLGLSNLGPSQIAQNTTFTATNASADVYQPGNLDATCAGAVGAPDWAAVRSPRNRVYLTHVGATQGTRGCQNGGTGFDHYFKYTTGASAEVVDVLAFWTLSGDNDIIMCTTAFTSCSFGFSGAALDELDLRNKALAANTTYYIMFVPWTANAGTNNVRIDVIRK